MVSPIASMGDPDSADERAIWFWIIEYLLQFQRVNLDLSLEIMKLAPSFPYDMGKKFNELIALRGLEDLCNYGDGTLELKSTAGFDLSETCVDVLDHIFHEATVSDPFSRVEWQRDLKRFIMHKRSAMAKNALEEPRDAMDDVIIPDASLMKLKEATSEPGKPTMIVADEIPDEVGNEENDILVESNEGNKQDPDPSHGDVGKEPLSASKKSQVDEIVQECQLVSRHKESPETSGSLRQMEAPGIWAEKKTPGKRVRFSLNAHEKSTPSTRVVRSGPTLEEILERWRRSCKWKQNLDYDAS